MAKKQESGILETYAHGRPQAAEVLSTAPQNALVKKRRKQLVFLVTEQQETRLNHFRADLGNIKIQSLFLIALDMLLESKGQRPL